MEDAAPKILRSRRPKVEINEEPEIQAIPARPRSRARKVLEPEPYEPPEPAPVEEEFKIVKTRKPRKKPEPGTMPSKDVAFTSSRGPINFQAYLPNGPYEHLHGSNRFSHIMSAW